MSLKHKSNSHPWPDYPKTVIQNGCIFVVFEDKSIIRWGMEAEDRIKDVAVDIEDGLRAIRFLTDIISQAIKESCYILESRGFSDVQIKEYLNDSIGNIIRKENPIRKNCILTSDDNQKIFYVQ